MGQYTPGRRGKPTPCVTALGAVVLYLWASGKRGKLWTKGAVLAVGALTMNQAASAGAHMACWPQTGSIAEWNGYVRVRFEE